MILIIQFFLQEKDMQDILHTYTGRRSIIQIAQRIMVLIEPCAYSYMQKR